MVLSASITTDIPMSSADLNEQDTAAVLEVMRSGRLALGSRVEEFEQHMARYVGVKHAVAVNSGTAALHLAVKALGIGVGDEVLVPSFTFAASVNAFMMEGATPVFVDITRDTYNLDPVDLERKITPRTKAIMVVDVFGHPAPWDEIERIAQQHGLLVIDDCCEALGAEYHGRRLGSFGDVGAFAFYPNKQMTTGEGGMLVTNNDTVACLARSLRNQGRGVMSSWLQHDMLGYNYRLPELSAALGVTQLGRIEEFLRKREHVAATYTRCLAGQPGIRPPVVLHDVRMSWFVYVVTLTGDVERAAVMQLMEERGIPTRAYFEPLHRQPYLINRFGTFDSTLPNTVEVARRTIALPFHNNLPEAHVQIVVEALKDAVIASRRT